jgi:hypothetical protein
MSEKKGPPVCAGRPSEAKQLSSGSNRPVASKSQPLAPEEIVTVDGVEKRLTTFERLNERFALLGAPGSPSVYIPLPMMAEPTDAEM